MEAATHQPVPHEEIHDSNEDGLETTVADHSMNTKVRYLTVAVFAIFSLLIYIDKMSVPGLLSYVEDYYNVGNKETGGLTSASAIVFTISSPIFGYLGDRYNRKYLILGNLFIWTFIVLGSSIIPSQSFWLFLLLRGLVGMGEASFYIIAPTVISDMFVGSKRSAALVSFYLTIPIGMGLGFIIASSVAAAADDWRWALRITPIPAFLCCLLLMAVLKEPPRGMAEHSTLTHSTKLLDDVTALAKNKTLLFNTFGYGCMSYFMAANNMFAPTCIYYGAVEQGKTIEMSTMTTIFGLLVLVGGVSGVLFAGGAGKWAKRKHVNGDGIVCVYACAMSAVVLALNLVVCQYSLVITLVMTSIIMVHNCMLWPASADILLYTVIPTRRSMAEGIFTLFTHALGEALGPYLVGALSDYLADHVGLTKFKSLQYALYTCPVMALIGAILYVACAYYIPKDKARADAVTHGALEDARASTETSSLNNLKKDEDEKEAEATEQTSLLR